MGSWWDQSRDLSGLTARRPARYLYWTDWGDHSLIGRIGMDGSSRSVIVDTKITWPNGLTLDYVTERIYWADAREDCIEFASLDGSNRHVGQYASEAARAQPACWDRGSCSFRGSGLWGQSGLKSQRAWPEDTTHQGSGGSEQHRERPQNPPRHEATTSSLRKERNRHLPR